VAKYRLHCVGASGNAYKVALFLACANLDWEPVGIDFAGGQTRDVVWREDVNAMGEIPVLEVSGRILSQSGAILMWLAETTDMFAPASVDERLETMRWLLFDNHRFTGNYATYRFQNSLIPERPHPAVLAFLRARVESAFAIVERHLADHQFVLGNRPTIADFSMAGYIYYPKEETGVDIEASFPAIHAWRKRVSEFPGWKPPYELMPVGKSLMPSRLATTDHKV
jgi:glutathione S-transferase